MSKLICPRCKLPLADHEDGCPNRLSRRFFLGALGSSFAAAALAKVLPNVEVTHPEPGDTLVLAEPKVHEGGYITVQSGSPYDPSGSDIEMRRLNNSCERIAARHGRPVIGKLGPDVVRVIHHEEALRLAGGVIG